MIRRLKYPLWTLLTILLSGCASLDRPLRFDPAVRRGTLDNGLTYYVRQNDKPEQRLDLRMAVKAGSVLEEDNQQGLAHFLEHMAFNGTEHFAKQELVDYLESIGMGFGPDLNAYTSFDETVYMLQVPTDEPEAIDKGFLILRDWAGGLLIEEEEIDKERGVVIEEWRLRRGANQRIFEQQLPVLFKDSRYAERLPIGKKEVLESFPPERVRTYYEDWYRPELATVVAVGPLDPDLVEAKIREHFSGLTNRASAPERELHPVPDHEEVLFSVVSDPEATSSSVGLYFKRDVNSLQTEGDYRRTIVETLFITMLNQRLDEVRRRANPPYLEAHAYKGRYVLTKDLFVLGAEVEDNGILRGLEALLTEAERVRRYGFTPSELARTKRERLRWMQKAYEERHDTESRVYSSAYIDDFLEDTVSPGIEAELVLYERFSSEISLADVNVLAWEWMTDENRVILADGPEKEGVDMPTETALADVFGRALQADIEPYLDDAADTPLLPKDPEPGAIRTRSTIEELGVQTWTFANGARLVVKATDFKKDEILFVAQSPGGHSLAEDDQFIPASSAAAVVEECGLGAFSTIQLEKKLAGQVAQVGAEISELQEKLTGSCAPSDLETMLQLVYLFFTAPREDGEAFESYCERTKAGLENRLAKPEAVYGDTIREVMSQNHVRRRPWTPETVDAMDLEGSLAFYRDRFANAGQFTFFLVGDLDLATLEPLAEKYLGGLPGGDDRETWVDRKIKTATGPIEETVRKGQDAKARVTLIYTGPFSWSYSERHGLQSALAALNIRLRERVREELGGTYSVWAYPSFTHYPEPEYSITVMFGCAPDQVVLLMQAVEEEIEALKTDLLDDLYLTKVQQGQLRDRETDLKRNAFWTYVLPFYDWHGEDPLTVLEFEDYVNALSKEAIRDTARKYFSTENVARFILLPEEGEEETASE